MEEDQIVVDVEAGHLSESMQRKLDTLWGKPNERTEKFTIFCAPCNIHESKKNLFEPFVVSIGPFHHGNTSLRTMEEKKWRFLRDFISHEDHTSVDQYISEIKLLKDRTRRCYSEMMDLDSDSFVEMMLLDRCFVLEYFLKWYKVELNSIYEVGWNCAFIRSDLLLLENQIPFFAVEKLCKFGSNQNIEP